MIQFDVKNIPAEIEEPDLVGAPARRSRRDIAMWHDFAL
jgi:hypothetical protein